MLNSLNDFLIMKANIPTNAICRDIQITNSKCEKLLGIKIDHKLTFDAHIDEICKKTGQKINALSMVIPYMNITKQCTLLHTFFVSQANYCP